MAGSRYNAVAEEGITAKEIAEVTAKGLKQEVKSLTLEEAKEYFGWMAMFAGHGFVCFEQTDAGAVGVDADGARVDC
ncbi:hypothetical protein [Tunturiibacter psychrotolerans]|uniref:hypothetical protein n=1 Tax=Tunturiibacter psychrotolerans TaxID=3069686 RepID=UPI0033415158